MYFDFTPDPKVLIALTQTPMLPLDAVCELIDNSIDSFSAAKLQGIEVPNPTIFIDLPKRADIENNTGLFRIRDNGPGMTAEQAEKAIKAGFSGNNPYDTLGLFGMGFNISTGKLGRVTMFRTARPDDEMCTETTIDLEKINATKSYQLLAESKPKGGLTQGTVIEVHNWWPEGSPNRGFIKKLIQYGERKIREELGRRYATILRKKEITILVNKEPCEAFEHCIWGKSRFVERKGGPIPAYFELDKIVGVQRRCGSCRAIIPDNDEKCPACGCTSIRTIEERVTGWIGIQRFDDTNEYGIDLIRNGRAIRISEKSAFFEFVDELKRTIKDYPNDSQYGRIVGEISLDFVPVDFLKQDFQRSSDEWQRAMSYIRGDSSLQPTQPNADKNVSPMFKLYQGYRRVRTFGKTDMYMGYWDSESNSAKRISRDTEKEFYQKFKDHIPGYYDDAEWWKKVEEASQAPVEPLVECPQCHSQNLKEADTCTICGAILKGKKCIHTECGQTIPLSATICPCCGGNQTPEILTPWMCEVCGNRNDPAIDACTRCHSPKGTPNPLTEDYLMTISNKEDTLSIKSLTIPLADGSESGRISLDVYVTTKAIEAPLTSAKFPVMCFKAVGAIKIFIDKSHRLFKSCQVLPEEVIAAEVAMFIYDTSRSVTSYKEHNLSNLMWHILQKYWLDQIEQNQSKTLQEIKEVFDTIRYRLIANVGVDSESIFDSMTKEQQKAFTAALFSEGIDISEISELKRSGAFIKYVPEEFLLSILPKYPNKFFNGEVWSDSYDTGIHDIDPEVMQASYDRTLRSYFNSLETLVLYNSNPSTDAIDMRKAITALDFLRRKLV